MAGWSIVKKTETVFGAETSRTLLLTATLDMLILFCGMVAVAVALFPAASDAVAVMTFEPQARFVTVQLQVVVVG